MDLYDRLPVQVVKPIKLVKMRHYVHWKKAHCYNSPLSFKRSKRPPFAKLEFVIATEKNPLLVNFAFLYLSNIFTIHIASWLLILNMDWQKFAENIPAYFCRSKLVQVTERHIHGTKFHLIAVSNIMLYLSRSRYDQISKGATMASKQNNSSPRRKWIIYMNIMGGLNKDKQ